MKKSTSSKRPDWIEDDAIIGEDTLVDRFESRLLALIKQYGIFICSKLKEQDPKCFGYYALAQGYIGGLTDQQRETDLIKEYSRIMDSKIKVAVKKCLKEDRQSDAVQKLARTVPQGTYIQCNDIALLVEEEWTDYVEGETNAEVAHNTAIFTDACRITKQYAEEVFDRGSDIVRAEFFKPGIMPEHANNYMRREEDFMDGMAYMVELYDIPSPAEVALRFANLVERAKTTLLTTEGFRSATIYQLLKDIDELHMDDEADLASVTSLLINLCTNSGDHEVKRIGKQLKLGNVNLPQFCDLWMTYETERKFAQSFVDQQSASLKPKPDAASSQRIKDLEANLAKMQKQIEQGSGKIKDNDKKVRDAADKTQPPMRYEYDQWDAGTVAKLYEFTENGKVNFNCPLCARPSPYKTLSGYPRHDANHCMAGQQFSKPAWATQASFDSSARKAALGTGSIHKGPTMILNKGAPIKQQGYKAQQNIPVPAAKTYTLEEVQAAHSEGFAKSQEANLVQQQQQTVPSPQSNLGNQVAQSFAPSPYASAAPSSAPPPQWSPNGYQHNFGMPGGTQMCGYGHGQGDSTPY